VVLDPSLREGPGRTLIGGSPKRLLRLSPPGWRALSLIREGRIDAGDALVLAERLIDSGMAHPRPEVLETSGEVTVVVPVRDRCPALERCLDSLPTATSVIVVDDGSRDQASVAAIATGRGARLIRRPRSGGPAAARNSAVDAVDTDIVAFLDSDCVAPPDWLAALIGHFEDPRVAAVAPRISPMAPGGGWLERYLASRSPLDMGMREGQVAAGGRISYVPSAALLVRRSCLRRGFDETLRYGEDVDLVWRLRDAGWTVRYDPAVVVAHEEPARFRYLLQRRFRYGASAAPLAVRHPRRAAPVVLHWAPAASLLLLSVRRRRAAAAALAIGAATSVWSTRGILGVAGGARNYCEATAQTALSLSRYLGTISLPLTIAAARRTRSPGLLALCVLALLFDRSTERRGPAAFKWSVVRGADDLAYSAGVWWGAINSRTFRPLVPRLLRSPRIRRVPR
jgi:mycofactocin system glycosyltransferase